MGKVKKKIIYYWSPSNYLKQSIHNHFKMQRVIHKCLFPYVALKFPTLEKDFKYIVRDNYYCRLRQLKYVYKDYFSRRAYKEITYQSEFDQELKYALPFAYWHFLNGTLKKTISSKDTSLFYFFSKDHEERFEQRNWHNSYINYDFPNMVHSPSISFTKWARVPLKEKFSNTIFRYNKPILVIANKYNTEWGKAPINYLDIKSLEKIFDLFQDKYQIIYNRPGASYIVGDNSEILDLNEFEWIKKIIQI